MFYALFIFLDGYKPLHCSALSGDNINNELNTSLLMINNAISIWRQEPLRSCCIQVAFKLHSGSIQVAFKLHSSSIQVAFK